MRPLRDPVHLAKPTPAPLGMDMTSAPDRMPLTLTLDLSP